MDPDHAACGPRPCSLPASGRLGSARRWLEGAGAHARSTANGDRHLPAQQGQRVAEKRSVKCRRSRGTASRTRKEEVEVERKAEEKGSAPILLTQQRCHSLPEGCREEGLHEPSQREGRRVPGWGVCTGKQQRQECSPGAEHGCPCTSAQAGMKYCISFSPLTSGGLDPDSSHPVSCPWKAPFSRFLIYFKAHRQKQRGN